MDHKLGKRLISGVMALILALGCVPVPAAAQGEGTENTSYYSDTASYEVTRVSGDEDALEETVFVEIAPSEDFPDNEELFQYFLARELYGYDFSTYGTAYRSRLNPAEQSIYDALKQQIEEVALHGGSTSFVLPEVSGVRYTWTNEELGISDPSAALEEARNRFYSQFDVNNVITALRNDCPFDLYWYDKTIRAQISSSTSGISSGTDVITITCAKLTFKFPVAESYQSDNYCVTTDVSKVQTVKNNAAAVVSQNQGKTAYQKLIAYKDYICQAVDYNFDALKEGTPYGDPWQLIYVFDGDPSTKVVCEGYSKAFQYLCDLSGLDCLSVVGTMDGEDHMWNVVTLDGKNYLVDVTNSDTGSIGQYGGLFLVGGTYQNGGYNIPVNGEIVPYICEDLDLAKTDYTPGHECHPTKYPRVEPTCTEAGRKQYWQCTSCGKRYDDAECSNEVQASSLIIPATGHDMNYVPAKEATCTGSGNKAYFVCVKCGAAFADKEGTVSTTVEKQTIPAKGHQEETITGKEATCTETGLTDGKKCTVCEVITVEQKTIPAKGHQEETITGKAATCTETGLTDGKKCTVCGDVTVKQKTIPAKGHQEETITGKAATCTETGLTDGKKCTVCEVITVEQKTIPAKGHQEETITGKAATCTETGLTEGKKCTVCGDVTVKQTTIPAKGHQEETITGKAATCTETGLTEGKKCTVCGDITVKQTTIPAKGHQEETITGKAATCTETGLTDGKKCTVCEVITVEQKVIPAAHKEVTVPGKAATCTEAGLTDGKKCSVCDKELTPQKTIPALDHKDSIVSVQKATLTKSGLKSRHQCMNCGKYFTDASCSTEVKEDYFIIPAVKTVKLSSTRYSYDGKTKTPKVGVYDSEGNKLVKDVDYTVTYAKGRKSVGQYNVTMKGTGDYEFRTTLTFQIVPPKSGIKALSGKSKSFTASWSKKTSQVTGYQLQYSLDKNFETGVKTVTIKDNDVTSKTIKSLKSKKYYYVRIRTYKTISGKNFYSSWSDALRVKTK